MTTSRERETNSVPLIISYLLGPTTPPAYLRQKPDTVVPDVPRCLYCMRTAGPFKSDEHIIPEGLGNKHLVLRRGVACDPCNNGPLSVLDQEFLNFMPVALMRTVRGVPTKQGQLPGARFGNASLRRVGPSEVVFETNSRKAARPIPGGFKWNLSGRRMTEAYTAQLVRFLFKAALGCTYIDRGRAVSFSPEFDETRHIVLGAQFHGYLAMANSAQPHASVHFTHWPIEIRGKPTVLAIVDVFGVSLATDLFVRRPDWLDLDRRLISVIEF